MVEKIKFTKQEFIQLMKYPQEWLALDMYPDALFNAQIASYQPGSGSGSENYRYGAFRWWLDKNLTQEQLKKLIKLASLDPHQLMAQDVRARIRENPHFDDEVKTLLPPEAIDLNYLKQLVGNEKSIILEIGANDGMHTQQFLDLFPNAIIYAFEPDPRAIKKFKDNVKSERVFLFECAIGAIDGEAIFQASSGLPDNLSDEGKNYFSEGWDQSGSLRSPKRHLDLWPWVKFEKTLTVPVKRLDTWFRENHLDQIDLIWADVQGAEVDLIAGGTLAFSRTRFFYTEYSNDELYEGQVSLQKIIDDLKNFEPLQRYPMDVLLKNRVKF